MLTTWRRVEQTDNHVQEKEELAYGASNAWKTQNTADSRMFL